MTRLIDADALSEKLCETTIFIKDGEVFQRMINDAPSADRPTVDKEYLINLIQGAVYDGEACEKLIDLVDRPTGEWIRCKKQNKADIDNGNALYECSNCGHRDIHAETQEVPYCWYCGAKMGGK